MNKIGIDVGGMSVKYGLVNEENVIIARHSIPTDTRDGADAFIKEICEGVKTLLELNYLTIKDIKSIGVGIPGIIDSKNGIIVYSSNLNVKNVKFVEEFKKKINVPTEIANDADAAGLGEVYAGAAKGADNAVLLTLGTGIGGGVIIDRKIFSGPLSGGCEIGHMIIKHGGVPCACGNKGCFEAYASASAIIREGRAVVLKYPKSKLTRLCNSNEENVTAKMVFECAKDGDEQSMNVVNEYYEYLSVGIANVVNIFRPEMIIIGGGVSNQKEELTDKLHDIVKNLVLGKENSGIPKIVTSILGNDAGIIGAANLI